MSNYVNLLDIVYPVGSMYFSTSSTSPSSVVGGTWEQIKDANIAAIGSKYTSNYIGSYTISLSQMPAHKHDLHYSKAPTALSLPSNAGNWNCIDKKFAWTLAEAENNSPVTSSGGGQEYYPYSFACYVWKRTA